jgi:TatD DNase family protein
VLIDCHAHLGDPVFDEDRNEVLARAREAGVGAIVTVGETLPEARRILELAGEHEELRPAAGLYPTHLDPDAAQAMLDWIREQREKLVAIGEVGLDHWKVREPAERELQREIFSGFVRLAAELELPLNIHSRSAGREVIGLLLAQGARRVQLHAFDGRPSRALPAVEAGYLFSIPTSVLYSRQKQKLVKRLPLSCLLLETDSPVMAPTRGTRNEPANLPLVVQAIAELKGVTESEVAETTTDNAQRLLGTSS